MLERVLLASSHLLAFGIGFGAVWTRGRVLIAGAHIDDAGLRRALLADNFWGVSAGLWLVSGLMRAFGGFEKGSTYYLHNTLFWIKMSLFVLILLLELRPMIGLIGVRIRMKKALPLELSAAREYGVMSHVQAGLLIVMVGVACAMARGAGM